MTADVFPLIEHKSNVKGSVAVKSALLSSFLLLPHSVSFSATFFAFSGILLSTEKGDVTLLQETLHNQILSKLALRYRSFSFPLTKQDIGW